MSLIRDLIYRMVTIFRFDHMIGENQQFNGYDFYFWWRDTANPPLSTRVGNAMEVIKIANNIEINHLVSKSFHLQIGYNLKFMQCPQ